MEHAQRKEEPHKLIVIYDEDGPGYAAYITPQQEQLIMRILVERHKLPQ